MLDALHEIMFFKLALAIFVPLAVFFTIFKFLNRKNK